MSLKTAFTNTNALSFSKWLFLRDDKLKSIVFFFISGKNATSPRFFPLFNETQNTRIVYFRGPNLPYLDKLWLKSFVICYKLTKRKVKRYEILHLFSLEMSIGLNFEYYHLDDPTYSDREINKLNDWAEAMEKKGAVGSIICTCTFVENWLRTVNVKFKTIIIEQGFSSIDIEEGIKKNEKFSYVYSSPYIHYGRDKHGNHSTWGAGNLIDFIIPGILGSLPGAQIHLVGDVGRCAKKTLSKLDSVVMHGRVDQITNQRILRSCHVGLYPRKHDHKRSVQKIYEYLGANLPVVTYDLTDTEVIKTNHLGFAVVNESEFLKASYALYINSDLYLTYAKRIEDFKQPYSWKVLAEKMEKKVNVCFPRNS